MTIDTQKIVSKKARISFPNLFTPQKNDLNGKDEYSVQLMIPKKDKEAIKVIKDAWDQICETKWGKEPKKMRSFIQADEDDEKYLLRDGDILADEKPKYENMRGHYIFTLKTTDKPEVVGADKQEILSSKEVYGGCYGRAVFSMWPYDNNFGKGISNTLLLFQKLEDGEPFGGDRVTTEDMLDALDDAPAASEDDIDDVLA